MRLKVLNGCEVNLPRWALPYVAFLGSAVFALLKRLPSASHEKYSNKMTSQVTLSSCLICESYVHTTLKNDPKLVYDGLNPLQIMTS